VLCEKDCASTESEQLQNDEQAARWSYDYEATKIKLDEAAKRFERLQTLFTELIDLFREAEAVDRQVSVINGSAPSGEFRRLHCKRAPAPLRFTPDRDIRATARTREQTDRRTLHVGSSPSASAAPMLY
jgi:hypothetical protein